MRFQEGLVEKLWKIAVSAVLAASALSLATAQDFKPVAVAGVSPNTSTALNNSGEVVVNVVTPSSSDLQLWNQLNGTIDLQLAGVTGVAINSAGDVVGAGVESGSQATQAFFYSPSGGEQWMGSLGGGLSAAMGLNDSADVVGFSYTSSFQQHAFLWTSSGGMQDLTPDVTTVEGATATGINSSNEVVGYYFPVEGGNAVGFTWTQVGGMQNLGSDGTIALGINNAGSVVGQFTLPNGAKHAFLWTQSGGMQDLGTLGGAQSTALAINNLGWVVGTSMSSLGDSLLHGFLWTPSGGMQDFTTIAGIASGYQPYSVGVNDAGVIALTAGSGGKVLIPKMTVTLTSSPNPSVAGKPVTFTATVSCLAGSPPNGETVDFIMGGNVIGSGTLSNGVAQFTTSSLAAGSRKIAAEYVGDTNYLATKSATLTQVVNPSATKQKH
jgi:probable HAF family extracellular repeat protein